MTTQIPLTLAEGAEAAGGFAFLLLVLFALAVSVLMFVAQWRVFEKAGQPGWAALVPIYNGVVMCRVGGKPGWWVILLCIPLVNFIVAILVVLGVAERFGQGALFAIGIMFLPFIFLVILAFGDYEWRPVV